MFNEKIKQEYIDYKLKHTVVPEGSLERLFDKTELFENKFKKDVSCFTTRNIYYFMKLMNLSSTNSLVVMNSMLALYTDWCLYYQLVPDGQNHFREIQPDLVNYCTNLFKRTNSIFDKNTIYSWIDELVNPCDQFILLALYEGIKGKDLCELVDLRLSDFDNNNVTLHTDTGEVRTINVSDKLVHLAHQSATEDRYYQRHIKNGDVYYTEISYLPDGDLILKNYPNVKAEVSSFQHGRRLIDKLLRIAELFDNKHITVSNIVKSGKINFIKERCEELDMSGEDYLYSDHIKELNLQFKCNTVRSTFTRLYREFLP